MKRFHKIIAATLCTFTILTLAACGRHRLYATAGVVTVTGDTVYVTDSTGNVWSFEGAEDWQTGDQAAMLMDDNGTETIYDDEILQIRYVG